jgi:hypothetical protein
MTHDRKIASQRFGMKFLPLGRVVITAGALHSLSNEDTLIALARHHSFDWGDVSPGDWESNDEAMLDEGRILSIFKTESGEPFWIITEADRSSTTILLPSDY